jgi:hypothetical protein
MTVIVAASLNEIETSALFRKSEDEGYKLLLIDCVIPDIKMSMSVPKYLVFINTTAPLHAMLYGKVYVGEQDISILTEQLKNTDVFD